MSYKPLLKRGDRGTSVKVAQELLKEHGYLKNVDGIFGSGTEKAVKAFQKDDDEVSDGIIGERTWSALRRNEKLIWRLKEKDYEWAAKELNCDINAIKAVSEVESAGGGFLEEGKPKILFERHWMRRKLNQFDLPTLVMIADEHLPHLVNKDAGGYEGGEAEHMRFQQAYGLNHEAAIESTSWGRFQCMGFHHMRVGFSSPETFRMAMEKDEGEHLKAFVRFIRTDNNLLKAIQEKDWNTFAYHYNGPQYQINQYGVKMKEAYERLTK